MQYGAVSGLRKPISRLVQGTGMVSSSEQDHSFELLDDRFVRGCNTFDTRRMFMVVGIANEWWVNEFGNRVSEIVGDCEQGRPFQCRPPSRNAV